MSSSSPSLRKRGKKEFDSSESSADASSFSSGRGKTIAKRQSEWDYRLALTIITLLAFITRFYKISFPAEVVFDEVHFGKVCFTESNCPNWV